jgi:uncharacterized protein
VKVYKIHKEMLVKAPIEKVFEFFTKPENLLKLTPPSMKMQILTPVPLQMSSGSIIDYALSPSCLPLRWTAFISEFSPPRRFVDTQLRGPYTYWHHTHSFQKKGKYTQIIDDVNYAMPLGYIGILTHTLFVERQLKNIFMYREKYLKEDVRWDIKEQSPICRKNTND